MTKKTTLLGLFIALVGAVVSFAVALGWVWLFHLECLQPTGDCNPAVYRAFIPAGMFGVAMVSAVLIALFSLLLPALSALGGALVYLLEQVAHLLGLLVLNLMRSARIVVVQPAIFIARGALNLLGLMVRGLGFVVTYALVKPLLFLWNFILSPLFAWGWRARFFVFFGTLLLLGVAFLGFVIYRGALLFIANPVVGLALLLGVSALVFLTFIGPYLFNAIFKPVLLALWHGLAALAEKALALVEGIWNILTWLWKSLWANLATLFQQLTARHYLLFAFTATLIAGSVGLALSLRDYPDWPWGDPPFAKVLPYFVPAIFYLTPLTLVLATYVWREALARGVSAFGLAAVNLVSGLVKAIGFVLKNFVGKPLAWLLKAFSALVNVLMSAIGFVLKNFVGEPLGFLWKSLLKPILSLAKYIPILIVVLFVAGVVIGVGGVLVSTGYSVATFLANNPAILLKGLEIFLYVAIGAALLVLLVKIGPHLFNLILKPVLLALGRGLIFLVKLVARLFQYGLRIVGAVLKIIVLQPLVLLGRGLLFLLKQVSRFFQWMLASAVNLYHHLTARHYLLFAFIATLISGGVGLVLSLQAYPNWPQGDPAFDKVWGYFLPAIIFAALTILLAIYVWSDSLWRGLSNLSKGLGTALVLFGKASVIIGEVFFKACLVILAPAGIALIIAVALGVAVGVSALALVVIGAGALALTLALAVSPIVGLAWIANNQTAMLGIAIFILFVLVVRMLQPVWKALRPFVNLWVILGLLMLTPTLALVFGFHFAMVPLPPVTERIIGFALLAFGLARSPLLKDKVAALLALLVNGARGTFTALRQHPRVLNGALVFIMLSSCVAGLYFSKILCDSTLESVIPNCTHTPPPVAQWPPCPAKPIEGVVEICFYSSNTKEDWVDNVTATFNAAQNKIASGEVISVTVYHVSSGSSKDDILNRVISPTVWSPGDQSWVEEANRVYLDRTGQPLVQAACPPAVISPIGFAMWRPMAEALGWPGKPIEWGTLVSLAADPQGWSRYGHPEWGQFKFGHTHPGISNSGKLIMVALAYDTLGITSDLTYLQAKSDAVVAAMAEVEAHTYHYGQQSRDLLALMVRRGPDYLHATNTTEAETLKTNLENADKLKYPLAFVIPANGTFWTEQPYCILDASWVSAEQHEAATLYRDYLLAPAQQALAIDNYLRPVDPTLPLHAPIALANGTDPRVTPLTVPALQSPSAEAASAIQDVFQATKKKATIVIVLDTSGSMQGEMMTNAIAATTNFLRSLHREDEVYVIHFGDTVTELGGGRAGDVAETLSQALQGLPATGKTALYDAVCVGTDRLAQLKSAHEAEGQQRLYGLVLLSDGEDTSSQKTQAMMFDCLPRGATTGEARVYTIAYGDLADTTLLKDIATRTNGRAFTGDPATIENVYIAISAEQ